MKANNSDMQVQWSFASPGGKKTCLTGCHRGLLVQDSIGPSAVNGARALNFDMRAPIESRFRWLFRTFLWDHKEGAA